MKAIQTQQVHIVKKGGLDETTKLIITIASADGGSNNTRTE